jgi:uroporphyrinogen III methyltransferase/synthase
MLALGGKRIVVTRPLHQAEDLARPLRQLGAEVILLPVISIMPPVNPDALRRAVARMDSYDWIIFSSANAVAALLSELGKNVTPPRAQIAAVGTATKEAIEEYGWRVDVTPTEFIAESLVKAFPLDSMKGRKVLVPSPAVTRDVIPPALRQAGAIVDVVEAYRTAATPGLAEAAVRLFSEPFPDWVTFASPSAVENLLRLVPSDAIARVRIASIGPVTSAALRKRGFTVHAEPEEHTVDGMVQAIVSYAA